MTYHSKPRPKIQHWPKPAGAQTKPKESVMKKLFVTALFSTSIILAPPAAAFPCDAPSPASWCAVRDGGSLAPASGNSGPRSGKTGAADGTEPAIRFRIPGWKAPVQKRAAGDGVAAPIRWR